MAEIPFRSRIKSVIYTLFSFFLCLTLFVISLGVVLEATLLNPEFLMDNMNTTSYFTAKKEEITQSLIDLGYASGLDEAFFENFVDDVMLSDDTRDYLDNYYSGNGTTVDTTAFKQSFNEALDEYIEENSIESVDNEARENLVKEAAKIYKSSLELPLFTTLSAYFISLKNIMPMLITGLVIFAAVLCLIIIFTNKWKHRAFKYICYATSGAALSIIAIPIVVFVSGKIEQINLTSRALYSLFVQCANNIFIAVLFCGIFFLVVSIGLYFLSVHFKNKVSGGS